MVPEIPLMRYKHTTNGVEVGSSDDTTPQYVSRFCYSR